MVVYAREGALASERAKERLASGRAKERLASERAKRKRFPSGGAKSERFASGRAKEGALSEEGMSHKLNACVRRAVEE